jgi:nucleoside-diphosphate-sugar epimerase
MEKLTIVVTGAAGFIGREVVSCARARGHLVRPVIRRISAALPEWDDGIEPIVADILNKDDLVDALDGADIVIHLAAKITGDSDSQRRDTVDATQSLCEAIVAQPVIPRLVLISSISVYAHDAVAEDGVIDENSSLEATPEKRDIYCLNKLEQEQIARSFHATHAMPLTVLRPGAVFGVNNIWNAHLGVPVGPVLVQFTRKGQLPVIYLGNCAQAILKACETEPTAPINLIDSAPPSRAQYLRAIGWQKATVVFPWRLLALIGKFLPFPSKPGLLRPANLQARMMPLRYATVGIEELMAGESLAHFDDAIRMSCGGQP